jgi:hypothetical protein
VTLCCLTVMHCINPPNVTATHAPTLTAPAGVAQYDVVSYDMVTVSAAQSISSTAVTQANGKTILDFTIPLAAVAPSTRAIIADGSTVQTHIWAYTDGDNM